MIEGVASLQRGDHPSVVKEKLQAFLSPAMREES
jgi:chemotaxis protein MotA